MYGIKYEWKEFKVYLPDFDTWLKSNAGEFYKGISADNKLTIWFSEEPTEEIQIAIDLEWDACTEEGEAVKFSFDENILKAIEASKTAILTADFADLIPAERKLWMNIGLSTEDKIALLAKYPQS